MENVVSYIKKLWSVGGVVLAIVSAFSLVIFYNPSGFSYVDFMLKYHWDFKSNSISAMFTILGAVLLLTPTVLDMPSAWKAAGFKGKFLFAVYLLIGAGFMFVTNHYDWKTIIWYFEFAAIAFMLWGAYVNHRDKKKYSRVGTTIEESETTLDITHDDD
jgi:hypothetical protein